jgi:hypothetical protein
VSEQLQQVCKKFENLVNNHKFFSMLHWSDVVLQPMVALLSRSRIQYLFVGSVNEK